jgi:hypothetical protein
MATNIDQYQPCVCGSGKKLKFCKCGANENVAELERILRLIEGEQALASLDRINQLLTKNPSAAWLLAIKCELTLAMQEVQPFLETSGRFLRLKPDNPLALIYCSIAAAIQEEPIENQARMLLEGLAESGENAHFPTAQAILMLTDRIQASGNQELLGIWGEMDDSIKQKQPQNSALADPRLNLLCKGVCRQVPVPSNAAWTERIDEVEALSSHFRFEQAEKKLQAILRDYPNQPGPLSHLLRCQVAQLNRSGAIATAKKLAEHPDLHIDERAYYRALQWEYEQKPLQADQVKRYGEIESDEPVIQALTGMAESKIDQSDESRQFMAMLVGDSVPAKEVFQVFSGEQTEHGLLHTFVGIVAVYGRQTDKPPRALVIASQLPKYQPLVGKILENTKLINELEQSNDNSQSYTEFLERNKYFDDPAKPWLTFEQTSQLIVEDFLNFPQRVLDGKTPLEAAQEERLRDNLRALLLHLSASTSLLISAEDLQTVYSRLGIDPPAKAVVQPDGQGFILQCLADILKFDCRQLADRQLVALLNTVSHRGLLRQQYEVAKEILQRNSSESAQNFVANSILLSVDPDMNAKLGYAERLELSKAAEKQPVGRYVLARVNLLGQIGRGKEGQELMAASMMKYPRDPELLSFMGYLNNAVGRHRQPEEQENDAGLAEKIIRQGAMRQAARTESAGLILPGQSDTAAASSSKLWLPGT